MHCLVAAASLIAGHLVYCTLRAGGRVWEGWHLAVIWVWVGARSELAAQDTEKPTGNW